MREEESFIASALIPNVILFGKALVLRKKSNFIVFPKGLDWNLDLYQVSKLRNNLAVPKIVKKVRLKRSTT